MADNIPVTAGSGTNVATDDIGGIHYQRIKVAHGADGSATDTSAAAPLPVVQTGALPAGANLIGSATAVGGAAHDAPVSGNPVLVGGLASTAAPSAVSADGDAVRAWYQRNGAQVQELSASGALIGGDATNGLDVDVTRIIPGTAATHLGKAVDSAAGATDTGIALLSVRTDTLATLTPVVGDYVVPRVNSRGAAWTALDAGSALVGDVVPAQRATTNGLTSSRVVSAATTNATSLKASAGRIARIDLFNLASSIRYFKLYNKASAPTVGTDTPIWTIPIYPGTGFADDFNFGKYFATGIAYAITSGLADSDTAAVAAGDIHGSIDWI